MALHRSITMLRIATGLGLPRRQLCISQRLRSRLGCRIPLRQRGAHAREITSELRLCHGANIDGTHATRQQRPAVGYARHCGIPLRCQGHCQGRLAQSRWSTRMPRRPRRRRRGRKRGANSMGSSVNTIESRLSELYSAYSDARHRSHWPPT